MPNPNCPKCRGTGRVEYSNGLVNLPCKCEDVSAPRRRRRQRSDKGIKRGKK